MPREKELYRDTLERIRARADQLFPDKLVYSQHEAAQIIGVSTKTLYRRGLCGTFITAEQIARVFA
ncbi:MAG: hypothetical protein E7L17_10750 [Clostridium sp.]|uniref:hypothetical protein n=1 Tax=Clostridium sp. TaxID=1506 RepID=UPI00290CDE28|nr:hypothetical protein [Clostridium sp.]MDU7338578.1 hypothetical protein [Clostridium sp.]